MGHEGPFLPAGRAASSPPSTTLAPRGHGARPAPWGHTDRPGKEPLVCTGALITQGLSQPASGLPLDFPQTSPTSPGTQGAARCGREPPRLSAWLLHRQASAWGGSPQSTTLRVPHIAYHHVRQGTRSTASTRLKPAPCRLLWELLR